MHDAPHSDLWTDKLASSELRGSTAPVGQAERTARRDPLSAYEWSEVAILRAPSHERESAAVASALSGLGQVSLRDMTALGELGYSPPALAILVGSPLDLPVLLGVLSVLRSEVDEETLPILALGLASTEEEIVRLLAAGANESLSLPCRPGELRAKVRRLLDRRERRSNGVAEAPTRGVRLGGRYLVRGPVGSGAYGSVYESWDDLAGRAVALKVVMPTGPAGRERFLREAYTLAAVRDPHLAAARDVFEDEGRLVLVSDLIRGPTLRREAMDRGPLPAADVVRLLVGVTRALVALERVGLVHRDVKPANVVLRGGRVERPVLVDFGLAKRGFDRAISSASFVMGTPGYMAPELLDGAVPDGRADLFALGMLGRYALTGEEYRPDLHGSDLVRHMLDARVEIPETPELPGLAGLLLSLTERDPRRRPGTARQVLGALETLSPAEAP